MRPHPSNLHVFENFVVRNKYEEEKKEKLFSLMRCVYIRIELANSESVETNLVERCFIASVLCSSTYIIYVMRRKQIWYSRVFYILQTAGPERGPCNIADEYNETRIALHIATTSMRQNVLR